LVRLCVEAAHCIEPPGAANDALRNRLEKRAEEYAGRFAAGVSA
jgi:hypothetical protein